MTTGIVQLIFATVNEPCRGMAGVWLFTWAIFVGIFKVRLQGSIVAHENHIGMLPDTRIFRQLQNGIIQTDMLWLSLNLRRLFADQPNF